ncbi:MAG: sensor histidine kinase [Saprospiraceae bacterium]|nr:sensor histidine kinase [Saprospiraceae bacterium]
MMESNFIPRLSLLFTAYLIAICVSAQTPSTADFEKAWAADIPLFKKLSQIDSMIRLLDAYFDPMAKIQAEKALILAKENNLPRNIAELELTIGEVYTDIDIVDTAQLYLESSLSQVELLDKPTQGQLHAALAWLYIIIPFYDKALYHSLAAVELYKEIDDATGAGLALVDVGYTHILEGTTEAALPFLDQAKALLEPASNPKDLSNLYQRYMEYYQGIGDSTMGLFYANRCIEVVSVMEDKSYLSGGYIYRGRLNATFGNYANAERDYLTARKYAIESGYGLDEVEARRDLAGLYVSWEKHEQAIPLLEEIIDQYKKDGNDVMGDYIDLYQSLYIAYAGLDQYEAAFKNFQLYEELKDSIYNIEADRNIKEVRIKFETDQTESLLKQRQQQLFYSLGSLGLILVIAGLLWWAYRSKRKQNELLEKSNEEKAFLIKEIHHRVKNNLQVLSSLLSLQSDYIADPAALDAVMEGRNRVQSMGLIHQKLYMGENLAAVDMKAYILDLSDHLLDSFGKINQVKLLVDVQIPPLDVDTAIPLGLIINELVTNSLKYAFREEDTGQISIQLWINPSKTLCLRVADNGLGKDAIIKPEASTSFGTDLVKILSKKLKGKIQVDTEEGYATTIYFQRYTLK